MHKEIKNIKERMAAVEYIDWSKMLIVDFPKEEIKIIKQKLINIIQGNILQKKRWFGFAD